MIIFAGQGVFCLPVAGGTVSSMVQVTIAVSMLLALVGGAGGALLGLLIARRATVSSDRASSSTADQLAGWYRDFHAAAQSVVSRLIGRTDDRPYAELVHDLVLALIPLELVAPTATLDLAQRTVAAAKDVAELAETDQSTTAAGDAHSQLVDVIDSLHAAMLADLGKRPSS
jgi:hypothetical protein